MPGLIASSFFGHRFLAAKTRASRLRWARWGAKWESEAVLPLMVLIEVFKVAATFREGDFPHRLLRGLDKVRARFADRHLEGGAFLVKGDHVHILPGRGHPEEARASSIQTVEDHADTIRDFSVRIVTDSFRPVLTRVLAYMAWAAVVGAAGVAATALGWRSPEGPALACGAVLCALWAGLTVMALLSLDAGARSSSEWHTAYNAAVVKKGGVLAMAGLDRDASRFLDGMAEASDAVEKPGKSANFFLDPPLKALVRGLEGAGARLLVMGGGWIVPGLLLTGLARIVNGLRKLLKTLVGPPLETRAYLFVGASLGLGPWAGLALLLLPFVDGLMELLFDWGFGRGPKTLRDVSAGFFRRALFAALFAAPFLIESFLAAHGVDVPKWDVSLMGRAWAVTPAFAISTLLHVLSNVWDERTSSARGAVTALPPAEREPMLRHGREDEAAYVARVRMDARNLGAGATARLFGPESATVAEYSGGVKELPAPWATLDAGALRQNRCPICGSRKGDAVDFVNVNHQRLFLVRCPRDGLLRQDPVPSDDFHRELQGRDYSRGDGRVEAEERGRRAAAALQAEAWKAHRAMPAGARVLEVGPGEGALLEEVRKRGWVPLAVDLSPDVLDGLRRKGIPGTPGPLRDAPIPDESQDVVAMYDVLPRTHDARAELTAARRILRPGGLLTLRAPNVEGAPQLHVVDHIYHFSFDTLKKLLESTGFEVTYWAPGNAFNGGNPHDMTVFARKRPDGLGGAMPGEGGRATGATETATGTENTASAPSSQEAGSGAGRDEVLLRTERVAFDMRSAAEDAAAAEASLEKDLGSLESLDVGSLNGLLDAGALDRLAGPVDPAMVFSARLRLVALSAADVAGEKLAQVVDDLSLGRRKGLAVLTSDDARVWKRVRDYLEEHPRAGVAAAPFPAVDLLIEGAAGREGQVRHEALEYLLPPGDASVEVIAAARYKSVFTVDTDARLKSARKPLESLLRLIAFFQLVKRFIDLQA